MSGINTLALTGTPMEIGAQLFRDVCMPVIQLAASPQGQAATEQQLVHLYAGFLQSCMGSMAADFGQERAIEITQLMVDAFKTADLSAPAPARH